MSLRSSSPALRVLWRIAKTLAAGACIAFVVARTNLVEVGSALGRVGSDALAVVALLAVSHVAALALRWRAALRSLGEAPRFLPLLGDLLVGTAYNSVLPSTVGGDVARAYRCATRAAHPPAALASIALERVVGFLCLAAVPFLGLALGARDAPAVFFGVTSAATAVFAILLVFLHVPLVLLARLVSLLSGRAGAFVAETAADLERVRPGGRFAVAGWSLVYQAFSMATFLVVSRSWPEPAPARAVLIGVPVAMILSALPVTIGGIGLRESLFVAVLGRLGVASGQALLMAAVWGFEWLALAIVGAVLVPATRLSPRETARPDGSPPARL
ncbi:MAG TPA: lysylphosphatidylglycerol synthase transmembrane domain-containing protein [Thermoanaerobaculia bacterium]|nr:lysylphosphatidylglycerol synthase transmembrane domain-containing protein [Thermoanaerobaculia bacterium]